LKYVLAADIGGTYTRIAVFTQRGVRRIYHRYENVRYPSLTALLHDFRVRHGLSFSKASLAVAGPVVGGEAKMPNLAWHVSVDLVKHALLVKDVSLVNDAYAAAAALDDVPVSRIKAGRVVKNGTRVVIGPGTGLGVSLSVWDGRRYLPVATEAGHLDFAPATELQARLWQFLHERYSHVSAERLVSGPGIVNAYYYFRKNKVAAESKEVAAAIDAADSPARAIVDAALAGTDGVAAHAISEFVSTFGSYAGGLALASGATGGVYLFGSIANKLISVLDVGLFEEAFTRKGRMKQYCEKIPVFVVKDPDVVLKGAYLLSKSSKR